MKLEKAIEILAHIQRGHFNDEPADITNATSLGIEALKAWKERRENYPMLNTYLLPGETED